MMYMTFSSFIRDIIIYMYIEIKNNYKKMLEINIETIKIWFA